MVKVYYTYAFNQVIGQAVSKNCNFIYQHYHKLFIGGVNQYVAIISAKTGEVLQYLYKEGKNIPVRHIYVQNGKIYAGYEDGQIIVWSLNSYQQIFNFDLHKATVSSIVVAEQQSKLVSAGFDGNIMIWDLLSEECQTIKSAHPSMITQILTSNIMIKGRPTPIVMSIGKDGFFRVWNMETGLCLTSLSCQVTQVYCMYIDRERNLVYVGTNKQQIVTIQFNETAQDLKSICNIRGIFKKKSYSRCMQMYVDNTTMFIFNADRTIELYKILTGKQIEARKKRVMNRKKKNNEQVEQPEEAELQLKFIEQKIIPFKFYGGAVFENRIFINNGTNIYQFGADKQITHGTGKTQQICLHFPFAVQRTPTSLQVYASNTATKLFSIQVKAEWCQIFSNGFLLVVQAQCVTIWNLSKNQQIFKLQQKWSGCWVKKNKCLLWRQNQLGVFQIGYDKQKNIKMKLTDSRRFEDKITEASFKHNMEKYIVNLQNSQIIINYSDSHKNFLKLYGHKLPILSYDLATDDALLATGSVDKDIRLWDMDFGHCIKSIFAHQQAITVVRFVPETHYLLSGSRDGHLKFWDMDTYQLIMDFQQNTMEIKSLAISQSGDFIIAGGADQGIRIWKQTNDQTIASDMEEKQMEKVMIEDYAKQKLGQQQSKTRYQDLKHGEQIIEALQNKQSPKTVISLIKRIPAANLKSCLSFLHERHVQRLQQYLKFMIQGNYEQEVCWRTIRQLNRGSSLGTTIKNVWRPMQKMIQLNTQILKTLIKQIDEENEAIK